MLINVQRNDGQFDMIQPWRLDQLLQDHKLKGFKRAVGWVVVGRDPVRHRKSDHFQGSERRRMQKIV